MMRYAPFISALGDKHGEARRTRYRLALHHPGKRVKASDDDSVLVDYDVFMNVPMLNAQDPVSRTTVYPLAGLDFRLRPGSAAIDRGMVIPNVTDEYTGVAPDLGALEYGKPVPVYGPRYSPHWK